VSRVTVRTLRAVPPAVRITLEGLRARWIPPGAPGVISCTVPWNPFRLDTVIVSFWEDPGNIVRLAGFAEIARPVIMTRVRVVFCVVPLAEPCTMIV
jgi:hypothetical protein